MIGTSYPGSLAEGVATTGVEGLEAIVAISAIPNWYDYYRANGMVHAPINSQGEDADVLADAVYTRADELPPGPRTICRSVIDGLAANEDRVTGDYSAFWNDRNYMKDVGNVHAAVLVAHGNNDWSVPTKNFDEFYEAVKGLGVPHMLYLHQDGHGGSPPDDMLNRWFTRYLWGVQNGVENLPKAYVVRESYACPNRTTAVGAQANVVNIAVADSSTFHVGDVVTITGQAALRTIAAIPNATHLTLVPLSTTLFAATAPTDPNPDFMRVNDASFTRSGHTITIDSGANLKTAVVALAGAGGDTSLGLAAAKGDSTLFVPSTSGFVLTSTVWIGGGSTLEKIAPSRRSGPPVRRRWWLLRRSATPSSTSTRSRGSPTANSSRWTRAPPGRPAR